MSMMMSGFHHCPDTLIKAGFSVLGLLFNNLKHLIPFFEGNILSNSYILGKFARFWECVSYTHPFAGK